MSQLEDLYNKSAKNNLVQARIIPQQAVNFVDRQNTFQKEFTLNKDTTLGVTDYTDKAQQYYNTELSNMVTPQSFVKQGDPTEPIDLNRYNPDSGYYNPGAPGSFGVNGG